MFYVSKILFFMMHYQFKIARRTCVCNFFLCSKAFFVSYVYFAFFQSFLIEGICSVVFCLSCFPQHLSFNTFRIQLCQQKRNQSEKLIIKYYIPKMEFFEHENHSAHLKLLTKVLSCNLYSIMHVEFLSISSIGKSISK